MKPLTNQKNQNPYGSAATTIRVLGITAIFVGILALQVIQSQDRPTQTRHPHHTAKSILVQIDPRSALSPASLAESFTGRNS